MGVVVAPLATDEVAAGGVVAEAEVGALTPALGAGLTLEEPAGATLPLAAGALGPGWTPGVVVPVLPEPVLPEPVLPEEGARTLTEPGVWLA